MSIENIILCDKSIGDGSKLEDLKEIAKNDKNELCRAAAIKQLGKRNDIESLQYIFELMLDPSEDGYIIDIFVLPIIAEMDRVLVLDHMKRRLEEPKENVRHEAIKVIAKIAQKGDRKAKFLLDSVIYNENESRRNRGLAKLSLKIRISLRDAVDIVKDYFSEIYHEKEYAKALNLPLVEWIGFSLIEANEVEDKYIIKCELKENYFSVVKTKYTVEVNDNGEIIGVYRGA